MDHRTRLAGRVTGEDYPLSIATSLAISALAGTHPDLPPSPQPPILSYQALWINLRTLFRNLYGSLDKESQTSLLGGHYSGTLLEEMQTLEAIIRELNPQTKVFYYVNNLPDLQHQYPRANLRLDSTPKQIDYTNTMVGALQQLMTLAKAHLKTQPTLFKGELRSDQPYRSALLTHYAFDLTTAPKLGEVDLLESHTGRLKPASQWYTKYYQGRDLPMIPFRAGFLPLFGDDTLFRPMPKPAREMVVALAEKYHWTSVTTRERIQFCLQQLPDPWLKAVLLTMI